ncbi:hypothetical protein CLPUN_46510 [Clostridium puniceum]|uniref:Flagellar assembly protein H n=1 Tax=Clostridium puniceum TaxID=29367 RepID=A0A1S8T4N7_9CLOT|nr:hypothetical protein CLPUN_46510 [Clostridium puniceum]
MNNKNDERKDMHYYESENTNNENCNFEFEFDINEADEYFMEDIRNVKDEDHEEEVYQKGFKDGYEKAKQELLDYIQKNKSQWNTNICKPRSININSNYKRR